MKFELEIRDRAVEDLKEAYQFYLAISEPLAQRFYTEVVEVFEKLETQPQYYSYLDDSNSLRDVGLKKFPFVVIFEIEQSKVII